MEIGDLVFDISIDQRGLIVESKEWEASGRPIEYEHTILYEGGDIDTAYENELAIINESW